MAEQNTGMRSESRRSRRRAKRRAREMRRVILATGFASLQVIGFWLANFADKDSWRELLGFLILQPVQILLNTIDSHWQLSRGMRDPDAVLLVTLLSLPLNVLLWYWVWRGWHKLRRRMRKRSYAPGSTYGQAPLPYAGVSSTRTSSKTSVVAGTPSSEANEQSVVRLRE